MLAGFELLVLPCLAPAPKIPNMAIGRKPNKCWYDAPGSKAAFQNYRSPNPR